MPEIYTRLTQEAYFDGIVRSVGDFIVMEPDGTVQALTPAQMEASFPDIVIQETFPPSIVGGRVLLQEDWVSASIVQEDFQSVPKLSFPVQPGYSYSFRFFIVFGNDTDLDISPLFAVTGPTADFVNYFTLISGVVPTVVGTAPDVLLADFLSSVMFMSHAQAAYDGWNSGPQSLISWSINGGDNFAVIEGIVIPTATGSVTARVSTTSASGRIITIVRGSYVDYKGVPIA